MLSLKTGKAIEKFPGTPAELAKLHCKFISGFHVYQASSDFRAVSIVDAILNALEAERTGTQVAKRERLRLQIGLAPNPA